MHKFEDAVTLLQVYSILFALVLALRAQHISEIMLVSV